MKPAILTLVLLGLCQASAVASAVIPTTIKVQDHSPISIHDCPVWLADTDVGNYNFYIRETVAFTNTDTRTARAIRFHFVFFNTFSETLGDRYGTLEGIYSPGAFIDLTHVKPALSFISAGKIDAAQWESVNLWNGIAGAMCSVDTVAFTDGSVWRDS